MGFIDRATAIAVGQTGNVYVTGGSNGDTTSSDYATIKYSQSIGINIVSNEIPGGFSLLQNYPNPFNPSTKIKFQIPKSGNIKIIIFDVLGKEVETLIDQQLQPGVYEVEWDASGSAGGQYFYRLESESFVETRKMIVVK